jgi:PPOX class probable FMN-dependent enzyme
VARIPTRRYQLLTGGRIRPQPPKHEAQMSDFVMRPEYAVSDDAALRALFPPTHDLAALKCLDHLDRHARDFIQRSPFLCIGTQDRTARADVSPRGDPAGFVKVLGPQLLAIPDRPGNNRLDTLVNILANPTVGLLFLVPGFDETLRVNGQASLTTDPDVLSAMAINDRLPRLAILVQVTEVFLHCAKAFRRSRLWDPSALQDRKAMPSLLNMILDQTSGAPSDPSEMQKIDDGLEADYKSSMY